MLRTVLSHIFIFTLFLGAAVETLAGTPAARVGDITNHGGQIVNGSLTVLIGGMPAARHGDHVTCPLATGLVPHVGGPIIATSPTVLINNLPAARVGDLVTEVGPPSTIAIGSPTVLIGN